MQEPGTSGPGLVHPLGPAWHKRGSRRYPEIEKMVLGFMCWNYGFCVRPLCCLQGNSYIPFCRRFPHQNNGLKEFRGKKLLLVGVMFVNILIQPGCRVDPTAMIQGPGSDMLGAFSKADLRQCVLNASWKMHAVSKYCLRLAPPGMVSGMVLILWLSLQKQVQPNTEFCAARQKASICRSGSRPVT